MVQPLVKNGNVLLWNGDLFNVQFDKTQSDTEYLSDKLNSALTEDDVRSIISELEVRTDGTLFSIYLC